MRRLLPTLLVLALACARNPVTGKRQLSLVSEKDEIALGQEAAGQVEQSMGVYGDPKVQAYVSSIGMRLAKASERPNLPWRFVVLDDPTVNAFALPGGPIFVTRGILTHLGSEAELASVLGHEIGHVTARHSVQQLSKAQLAQLGLGLGMIFSEDLRSMGQVAGAGLQLLFLKFGRDAERQSDQLGFRYMVANGYDPREMDDVFVTLERASASEGAGRVPEWMATHPDPGNRAETARKRAEEVKDAEGRRVAREEYLAHLGGMPFGADPRQGYFEGNVFIHPELRFRLELPAGWAAQNTPAALVAVSPAKDAAIQLSSAGKLSPEEATKRFFAQKGVRAAQVQAVEVHGLPVRSTLFEAQTQQGVLRGLVSFISHGGSTFQLVEYTPAERLSTYVEPFRAVIRSFGPVTDPKALGVQPAKIELVKVPRDMTLDEFQREFPSTVPPDRIAIVNGLAADGRLRAGETAKRVTGGTPAEDRLAPAGAQAGAR
jgi:predicted Zn-dependent protease